MAVAVHLPPYPWTRENVKDFILACRQQYGVPIFKTKYAGAPLMVPGLGRAVMAICWGGAGPEISRAFYNVPEDVCARLDAVAGDWRWLSAELGIRVPEVPALLPRRPVITTEEFERATAGLEVISPPPGVFDVTRLLSLVKPAELCAGRPDPEACQSEVLRRAFELAEAGLTLEGIVEALRREFQK